MRTKTLLLTAALAGLGVAANADVTSVNYVGYINGPIPQGYSIRCSGFRGGARDIATLMPAPPCGVTCYEIDDNGTVFIANFDPVYSSWDNPNLQIKHGQAIVVSSPCAFNNTFTGTGDENKYYQGGQVRNDVTPGSPSHTVLRSNPVPMAGLLTTQLGFNPGAVAVTTYQFKNGTIIHNWDPVYGSWDQEPFIDLGEGFFVLTANGTAIQWPQNFAVTN
jgi:hypothetical protein